VSPNTTYGGSPALLPSILQKPPTENDYGAYHPGPQLLDRILGSIVEQDFGMQYYMLLRFELSALFL